MSNAQNFHAGSRSSQEYLYDIHVATPSHAERARTMAAGITRGTLCTIGHPGAASAGFPYGSLVTLTLCEGHPIFLISGLAEHTKNLRQDPRCSLLITENGDDSPLALGRITLVGECREIPDEHIDGPKQAYLAAHPDAAYYLEYGDFAFWKLEVQSLRYIGGFGRMSWVTVDDWLTAKPDPLAALVPQIIEHMNDDHKRAMTDYCHAFSKATSFTDVKMTTVDRYGFEMSVETPQGWRPVRLGFERPVHTMSEVRAAMVEFAKRARQTLSS